MKSYSADRYNFKVAHQISTKFDALMQVANQPLWWSRVTLHSLQLVRVAAGGDNTKFHEQL